MKSKSALKKAVKKAEKKSDKKKVVIAPVEGGKTVTKKPKDKRSGVLYIGHIPHGYYEGQMKTFMSQYGKVKRLRLSRSKKSGKSKGFGFVQFEDPEVASAVAEEVNGTFVTGKVMDVKVVDPSAVHKNLWKGMKLKTLIKKDQDIRVNGKESNHHGLSQKTAEQQIMKLIGNERKSNAKLAEAGISYKFTGFEDQLKGLGIEYVPRATTVDSAAAGKQAAPEKQVKKVKKVKAKK